MHRRDQIADQIDWPFEPIPLSALNGTISDRFDDIAHRFASRLAIEDLKQSISYAALARQVEDIALATDAALTTRPCPVAILLPDEASYPVAILGVLRAGRGCVPLDPHHPDERNRLIVNNAAAAAVISAGGLVDLAARLCPGLPVLNLDSLRPTPHPQPLRRPRPEDLAYILYTSGSSGTPKGVYQNHQGLLQDMWECTHSQRISHEDRVPSFISPTILGGFRVILSTLLSGASLHILPPRELRASGVIRELTARRISIFRSGPALFRHVVEALPDGERLDNVRLVVLAGDRIDWRDFDLFRRACGERARMAVHIGATECSTYLYWYVDESARSTGFKLPVGRPVPGRHVLLFDDDGREVALGAVGEFVVASHDLALGYWRNADATTHAFSVDPVEPGRRLYHTGDLGCQRTDGLYEFAGRKDAQVKLHGYRIEPGEIESALASCSGVRDGAVLVRSNSAGEPQALVGYVELNPDVAGISPMHVTQMLRTRLPSHMMPSRVVILDALPRQLGLKIDRTRLAEIDAGRKAAGPTVRTQVADTERWLTELWLKILRLEFAPSPEDNFFELGADSLASAELIFAVEQEFSCELPLEDFFQEPTITTLRNLVEQHQTASLPSSLARSANGGYWLLHKLQSYTGSWQGERLFADSFVVGLNREGRRTPMFWVFQDRDEFLQLAKHLGPDQPLYGMRSCVRIVDIKDHSTEIIETVVNRYLWEILALPVKAPFFVGGNCQGGIIALALARRLKQIGRTPLLLILMEWAFSFGRYTEPTLLLYGDPSNTTEIYLNENEEAANWRDDFPNRTVVSIPGVHGGFFIGGNIVGLAEVLTRQVGSFADQPDLTHPRLDGR
jgi:amino acid adenylation domain-containing protein